MNGKIIGIIGGMGPYASAHFYQLLLRKSSDLYGAKNNDDYPEIVIDSVPVPYFISDTRKLNIAREMLISRVQKLTDFGCSILAMACNTGHIIFSDLAGSTESDFVSMIDLVANEARQRNLKRVGILATKITVRMAIYQDALGKLGIEVIDPLIEMQKIHERIIRSIVSGKILEADKLELCEITHNFIDHNQLDGIILGCTELPLIFPKEKFDNALDCLDILADGLLKRYYKSKGIIK